MSRHHKHMVTGIVLTWIISGCTGNGCSSHDAIAPELQLHNYIEKAVNITKASEREELVRLTSGHLKEKLVSMSNEAFNAAYITKRYDFRTFEIREMQQIDEKEFQIDFRLVYRSWNSGEWQDRAPLVDTTNRAYMVFELGQWAIAKVENLGSSFEWEVGMPLDDVRTTPTPQEEE